MNTRRILTGAGATFTTFVLVSVLVITVLDFEFSALVGLPVGALAAILAAVVFVVFGPRLSVGARRALSAYAAFGVVVLVLLAVSYVNLAGLRGPLTTAVTAGGGVAAAVVVYLGLLVRDRGVLE